ncbi:BlaI/MecI/CopY family transcriptional regulator [Dawidia soli]|uniref:BlaI/MecI/CopY family transcriptional regulator n=1 Tax=Dawidia soli TaxID=2782352 RepID=A0AAP2DCF4_9BACT|nr:BlaI/MecI/CopY family transcriptional regulator [Dawidia soli]MBT1689199.1 BlaI/MecI/CopY family transcriptional regulator [Dawidia soli]
MKELTKAEDQVMQILWKLEKAFVKDLVEAMPEPKPAYNTVSTIVRILETKGFVDHTAYGKTHEYYPLITKEKYTKFYLNNLLKGYFDGSFQNLVSFFARENKLSATDVQKLLAEVKDAKKGKP